MLVEILLLSFSVPLMFACLYYGVLTIVALASKSSDCTTNPGRSNRFAVIVPAHNEAAGIQSTLANLTQQLDYPREKYQVFVIADNCTDDTARLARDASARCLERQDDKNRGKGCALEYAFRQIIDLPIDVVLVVDADCRLDANALKAVNHAIELGSRVVQLNNQADNADDSPIAYATRVANFLENRFYNWPKSKLGWSVFLRGTGMAFHRTVLEQIPWNAASIVEDLEYSLELIKSRIRTTYLIEAAVKSTFPTSMNDFDVQRRRWIAGGSRVAKSSFFALLWRGLSTKNWLLLDAAASLWLQSRGTIIIYSIAMFVLCCSNWMFFPSPWSLALVLIQIGVMLCILAYGLVGILGTGITTRRLGFLFQLPAVLFRWILISLGSLGRPGSAEQEWIRSPRPAPPPSVASDKASRG